MVSIEVFNIQEIYLATPEAKFRHNSNEITTQKN